MRNFTDILPELSRSKHYADLLLSSGYPVTWDCFSAWAKKTDLDQEVTKVVVEEEKEEIPIIPYSSLFILSSENK